MLNKDDLKEAFMKMNVVKSDVLVLQSSYKGCSGFEHGPKGLVDALIQLMEPDATLIMPAYNLSAWTEHHYFDILETPCGVGIIPEFFRTTKGVLRTKHPIHSLSVWGKKAFDLQQLDYADSFGPTSVFAELLNYNAIYATIGLGDSMPFLPCHFTETELKTPYRRRKDFGGIYVDEDRIASLRVYGFHVRISNDSNPLFLAHKILMKKNEVKTFKIKEVEFCFARAKDYHQSFINYINENPDLFR